MGSALKCTQEKSSDWSGRTAPAKPPRCGCWRACWLRIPARRQVAGCDVVRDPEGAKSLLSYMSQRFGLYEDLTVDENIRFYADLFGVRRKQREQRSAGIAGGGGARRFPQPPGGKSFRRDEAKAGLGLRADSHAQSDPARRADQRSRSGVAAGLLADSLFAAGGRRGDSHLHFLPR